MNSHSELRKSILWFTENHPDIEVDLDATGEDGRVIHTLYVKGEEVSEHETLADLLGAIGQQVSPHYIAMSGSYGCLPDYCSCCVSVAEAVDSLSDLFELEEEAEGELRSALYIDLTRDHGAQYAEVVECNCLFPFEHSEE